MTRRREIKREIDICETYICPGYESNMLCYYERDSVTGKKLLELPLFCLGFSSDYEIIQGIKELATWIKDNEIFGQILSEIVEFLKKRHE